MLIMRCHVLGAVLFCYTLLWGGQKYNAAIFWTICHLKVSTDNIFSKIWLLVLKWITILIVLCSRKHCRVNGECDSILVIVISEIMYGINWLSLGIPYATRRTCPDVCLNMTLSIEPNQILINLLYTQSYVNYTASESPPISFISILINYSELTVRWNWLIKVGR